MTLVRIANTSVSERARIESEAEIATAAAIAGVTRNVSERRRKTAIETVNAVEIVIAIVIAKEIGAIVTKRTTVVTRRTKSESPTKTANETVTEIVTEIATAIGTENATVEDVALIDHDRGLLIDEESVSETETVIVDIAATVAIRAIVAVVIAAARPVAIGTATTRKAATALPVEPTSPPMARSPSP